VADLKRSAKAETVVSPRKNHAEYVFYHSIDLGAGEGAESKIRSVASFRRIVFAQSRCLRGFSGDRTQQPREEVETALSPRQKRSLSMYGPFSKPQPPNQTLQPTGLLARG
jgi:hypothetical protein